MTTIKLRAWDAENSHMVYDLSDMVGDTLNNYLLSQREDNSICIMREGDGAELPTMLSTGILDKNGKEIWEGDLVKHPDFAPNSVLTVQFSDGSFDLSGWDCVRTDFAKGEVIGNIYQDSHLLTSKG